MKKNYHLLTNLKVTLPNLPIPNLKSSTLNLFIALFTLFGTFDGYGQGTTCATATPLIINGACGPAAVINDTTQNTPNYATCSGTFAQEGWYTFTVSGGPINITITATATRNLALQLISSTSACTGLSQFNCVNNANGSGVNYSTESLTSLLANGFYYIKVLNVGGSSSMDLSSICVTTPPLPTITSFTPSSACASSSQTVVITGTGFTGATAVTIGSTAAASYVVNSSTQITATIGTGTTGTVQVTTPGGSSTSAATFTVNALPAITTQPVVTSICTTGSGTFSVVATGATTYQWRRAGVALTNVAPYSGVNTATLTITNPAVSDAGNFDVVVGNGTCTVTSTARALTVTPVPTITTNPANSSVGIGANTSFTAAGNNTPTSYTWQVSTDGGGTWTTVTNGGVYSNATTATLNITGATIGMNGYLYHASATNACGTSAYSTNALLTVANIVLVNGAGINNVACGTNSILKDHNGDANYGNNRNDWSVLNAGTGATITISGTYATENTYDFVRIYGGSGIGGTLLATYTNTGTINYVGAPGQTLTLQFTSDVSNVNTGFEVNISYSGACSTPCVTPTAQPTALGLTPAGTTINGTFTAAAPAPNSYLVIANTTGVAPSPVNGVTYAIGSGALGGTNVIIDTDSNTSFSATSLAPITTYYFFVYSMNDLCTGGPLYNTTSPLTGNATTSVSYCTPIGTNDTYPISNVTFAGINNTSSAAVTAGPDYQDFSAISGNVTVGSSYNISVTSTGVSPNPFYQYVFFDWNNNGDFTDDGGPYTIGTYTTNATTLNLNILIPLTATIGTIRMRVVNSFNAIYSPCITAGGNFQMEDYSLNIAAAPPCVAPTTAPTALILTAGIPSGTAINGSFTAAAPVPNGYLVVVSTSNVAPTPVNGTTYTISGNVGAGYTIVDTDANTTFIAAGLNPSTTYYFYVYSMNNVCSGGPLYYNVPLTGNLTTGATLPTYCNATTLTGQSTRYIDDISFLGMLNGDILNLNTGFTTVPAPGGYQDWTGIAIKPIQAQGGGVNVSFESNSRGTWKAWVDWNKDGDFTDAGEMVYTSAGIASITNTFGFIIPMGATPGNYRIRIRTYNAYGNYNPAGFACDNTAYEYYGDGANHFDSCTQFTSYNQFINDGCGGANVNFTEYGETEDYLFTVVEMCEANIVTVTNGEICGPGTVNVSVTGTAGTTQFRWYSAQTAGSLLATTAIGNWTTPSIGVTTSYWVTAFNGSCESLVRTEVIAKISPLPTISFTPSIPEVCGENNIVSITASGDTELVYLIDENFEGTGLGVFTNNHITSTAYNTQTAWQRKTSTLIPNGSSWYPAISSNFGANHFALVTSDIGANGIIVENALLSPSVNTNTFLDLTLDFRMYYSRYYPDSGPLQNPTREYMQVEVSTNSGATWASLIGPNIVTDQGIGTRFKDFSYNMNAYINIPNLRIRIRYFAEDWFDGAAVDDIQLFGTRPLNTSFDWVSVLPVDAYQDLACTLPYTTGTPAITVYIKPTLAQLELTTYSFTASATLNNGCSASSIVSINNKSKIWKGINGNWNDANNWSPLGVPDASNCVIIPPAPNNSLVGGTYFNGLGKTLQVIGTGNLTINPTNSLTITDFVEVRDAASVFNIEDSGSLVQINNVTNLGNINYKRIAPGIRGFDYVYWSSPVANQMMETIYSSPVSGFKYAWNTTVANGNAGIGNWENASGIMQRAKGYIIRGSSSYGMPATNISATFTGVPHNGTIPFTVERGSYTGVNYNGTNGIQITNLYDNLNLLGNPYPSGIDAIEFLNQNNSVILGNVKLWSHGAAPAAITNPFYGSFTYNYTGNDYVTISTLGNIPASLGNTIKSGQAFFVQMIDGTAGNGIVNFENTMRLNSGIPYDNGSFFKNSSASNQNTNTSDLTEKHRIWLDIMDSNNAASSTLVGYATGATDAFDSSFDVRIGIPNYMKIYSLLDNEVYEIQGKSLPFNQNDQIPLGITTVTAGNYTIGLNTIDGLFLDANQAIYLEDKTTNVIHNLKTSLYTFTSAAGTYHDRFVLRFTDGALGNDEFTSDTFAVSVISSNGLAVKSTSKEIQSVRVFDILGRELAYYPNVNSYEIPLSKIQKNNTTLIIKVTLSNGAIISKKAIY